MYYLLGEEFDRDPFLLFRLRGADREMVCGRLSAPGDQPQVPAPVPEPVAAPEPLSGDAAVFWASTPLPADLCGEVRLPPVSAAGPKRLGRFPFWRGTDRFLDAIAPIYSAAAQRGLALFEADGSFSLDTAPGQN